MGQNFSWDSPSARNVLQAALTVLAERGYAGLTVRELQARAGAAGVLIEEADLKDIVVIALQRVRIFSAPEPTGSLRDDLRSLLRPWLGSRSPDERAIAAVISAAEWCPRLGVAVHQAFDRPLAQALGTLLARAVAEGEICPQRVHTLNWVLTGTALHRLRAANSRTPVDLDALVDYLIAGLQLAGTR